MAKIDWEKDKKRRMATGGNRYAADPDGTGGLVAPTSKSYDRTPEESKWMGGEKEPESTRKVYDTGGPEARKNKKKRRHRWKKVPRPPGTVVCPHCPSYVKEENLQDHIARVHGVVVAHGKAKGASRPPQSSKKTREPKVKPKPGNQSSHGPSSEGAEPAVSRPAKVPLAHEAVRDAARALGIDLRALIAQVAIWAPVHAHQALVSTENPSGAFYPSVRRARIGSGEKPGTVVGGVRLDRNNYANEAIRRAIGLHNRRNDGYQACHIWPDSCYDERYHTVLANLVLIPGPLVSLTDFDQGVIAALQYRAYELFDWHPVEVAPPVRPAKYPDNWQKPAPPRAPHRRIVQSETKPKSKARGAKKPLHSDVKASVRGEASQRDIMRRLWRLHRGDATAIIRAWAKAERTGEAVRASNVRNLSPEEYGRRLLDDGVKKGWISD